MNLPASQRVDSPAPRRSSLVAVLPTIGQLACAHGFFGNLYEAIVRVPHRLSADYDAIDGDQRLPSLFSQGSPVRYYVPGVPISVGATFAALLTRRRDRHDRRWLGAAAAALAVSSALTGYLIRNVNIKLFVVGHPITGSERDRLLRTWYRLNTIRVVSLGVAWAAIEKVRVANAAEEE
jgi:Domain of unknown function (DUF1772)